MSALIPRSHGSDGTAADCSPGELQTMVAAQAQRIAELEAALTLQQQIADDLRRSESRLAVLAVASRTFAEATTDLSNLCQTITKYVAERIGDLCSLRLLSPDRTALTLMYTDHPDPEGRALAAVIDQTPQRADEGHTSQVIRDGRPLYIPVVPQEPLRASVPPQFLPYLDRFGVTSLIIVPMHARGQVIGTLTLTRNSGGGAYTPDDLAMLQDLADRAALAVSHAQALAEAQAAHRRHADDIALLDAVYANAPIGLAFLDTELRYVRANHMLAEMGGISVEDYPGRMVADLFPELASAIEPLHRHVLSSGETIRDIAIRGTTPAAPDTPRDWLASYYPVHGPDGAIVGLGVMAVDVTERVRAEDALREGEAQLHLAYDAAQLGTWRRDIATGLLHLDLRAQTHFGLSFAAVPLELFIERLHPEDHGTWRRAVAQTTDPGGDGRATLEYRVIHPDGRVHWLAVHARALFSGTGSDRRLLSSSGTSQDITARKEAEAALRASEERFRLLAEHALDMIYRYRLGSDPGFDYVSPSATALTGYTPEDHYADPDLGFKLVHPDDRELLQRLSRNPTSAGAPITLRWLRKDGSVMWTEQINQMITDADGVPVAIEGIARDVTGRKQAEEQVRTALAAEQTARRAAEAAAIRSNRLQLLATELSAALTRDAVAAIVTEHSRSVTGARTVAIAMLDTTGTFLNIIGSVGHDPAVISAYDGIAVSAIVPLEYALRTREPLWLKSREEAEAQFPGVGVLMERLGDHARATVPLVTAGRVIGVISLSFGAPTHFEPEDRTLLTTMAQVCAQALDRARLYDEAFADHSRLQQLSQRLLEAQEQERRHIARELHDEIGQVLGALKINLHVLGTHFTAAAPRIAESLGMVDVLIQQVRALSLDLRPSVLDDLGLVPALAWYCDRLQQRSGLLLTFNDHLDDLPVPMLLATACFRIAQEALTNVVRHAHARRVSVTLSRHDALLALVIHDDGIGFDVRARRKRAIAGDSLGLISMIERAELVGGWVDISSTSGTGTEIWAWLPLDAAGIHNPT